MRILLGFIGIVVVGCSSSSTEGFNSEQITSSKGERIYVNSLNWGVTGDHQMSVITKDPDRLKERNDTVDVIYGLDPFVYRFTNDTVKVFFKEEIRYRTKEQFKTITVQYISFNGNDYRAIRIKAGDNVDGYRSVPTAKKVDYPADMPKPPER